MRFTVRRLMAAVAVSAVVFVWWDRQSHRRRGEFVYAAVMHSCDSARPGDYHGRMSAKYLWAARHPWLPVWPDPPEPCLHTRRTLSTRAGTFDLVD